MKHPHIWSNAELNPWVRQRDNYLCRFCKKDIREIEAGNNSVHHIVPKELGGENNPRNCVTLCAECHRLMERFISPIKNMKRANPILNKALEKKFKEKLKEKNLVIISRFDLNRLKGN